MNSIRTERPLKSHLTYIPAPTGGNAFATPKGVENGIFLGELYIIEGFDSMITIRHFISGNN